MSNADHICQRYTSRNPLTSYICNPAFSDKKYCHAITLQSKVCVNFISFPPVLFFFEINDLPFEQSGENDDSDITGKLMLS